MSGSGLETGFVIGHRFLAERRVAVAGRVVRLGRVEGLGRRFLDRRRIGRTVRLHR
jgi:hypothetical protein